MANSEENINKDKNENRNINIEQNSPEILTNPIYTPAFLREQIGRLMRVEFLIGTNNMVDRIGILEVTYYWGLLKMIVWCIVIFIQ